MKTFDSRRGYDLYASHYRKDHPHLDSFDWDTARQTLVEELEKQMSSGQAPIRFLDLGCGDGRILKRLVRTRDQRNWNPLLELHGWDISENMLKQAAKAAGPTVRLQRQDLLAFAELPLEGTGALGPDTKFDLIASFFVLVHIEQPKAFCQALQYLLKPGCCAVFNNIPQRDALVLEAEGHRFQIEYCHHRDDSVLEALAATGLELIHHQVGEWSSLFTVRATFS